jgi:hypothetical protein
MSRARLTFASQICVRAAGLMALALGALACQGGQTGGENNTVTPTGGYECDDHLQPLTLDDSTPFGVSVAALLEPLLGTHRETLLWRTESASVMVGPESGESTIELTLMAQGGNVFWVRSVPKGAAANAASGVGSGCAADRVQAEVSVHLSTALGALDEDFSGTLIIVSRSNASLSYALPFADLRGSLVVTEPGGSRPSVLRVSSSWAELGFRGALVAEFPAPARGGMERAGGVNVPLSSSTGFIALWPPEQIKR